MQNKLTRGKTQQNKSYDDRNSLLSHLRAALIVILHPRASTGGDIKLQWETEPVDKLGRPK